MNEAQRLVYLEALGIQQWVAKVALPNAKATEFLDAENFFASNSFEMNESEVNTPKINHLQNETPDSDTQSVAEIITALPKKKIDLEQEPENQNKPEGIFIEDLASTTTPMPACALQIQGKRGQYLLIADLLDARGKVNSSEQSLLNNIAKAIDSLLENTSTRAIMPEHFKWPLFESHFKADHIDQSEQAAKESAQAFLYSHIKRNQLPLVIALGKHSHKLLGLDALEAKQYTARQFGEARFILGGSLTALMGAKTSKADLWEKLIRHFA